MVDFFGNQLIVGDKIVYVDNNSYPRLEMGKVYAIKGNLVQISPFEHMKKVTSQNIYKVPSNTPMCRRGELLSSGKIMCLENGSICTFNDECVKCDVRKKLIDEGIVRV